eukprot:2563631-Pleurochrysis_carterae.AAC.2
MHPGGLQAACACCAPSSVRTVLPARARTVRALAFVRRALRVTARAWCARLRVLGARGVAAARTACPRRRPSGTNGAWPRH